MVDELPVDLRTALIADATALDAWKDITLLARNKFICWVEDAKREKARERRIRRTQKDLEEGQRRPCCWPGCEHKSSLTGRDLRKRPPRGPISLHCGATDADRGARGGLVHPRRLSAGPRVDDLRDVAMIGAATAAEQPYRRKQIAKGRVVTAERDGITLVQIHRLVQLGMAQR